MDPVSDIQRAAQARPAERRSSGPPGGAATPDARQEAPQGRPSAASEGASRRASAGVAAFAPGIEGDLAARHDAARSAARSGASAAVLAELAALAFRPGEGAEGSLRSLVANSAASRQLAFLASAAVAGADSSTQALDALFRAIGGAASGDAARAPLTRAVTSSLGALVADLVSGDGQGASSARIVRALKGAGPVVFAGALREAGQSTLADRVEAAVGDAGKRPALDGALLRIALHTRLASGVTLGEHVLQSLAGGAGPADAAGALVLESARSAPAVGEALGRQFAAAEFEQAWNATRRELGDPLVHNFLVPDGPDAHATVQLVGDDREGGRDSGRRQGSESFYLTMGVDFSGLGPVRADVAVRSDQVALRLVIADPGTAQAVRAGARELEALLATGGRRVLLAVAEGSEEDASVDGRRMGMAAEDHLMDVEG